eukprot:2820059-Rhodomonas_salina.1
MAADTGRRRRTKPPFRGGLPLRPPTACAGPRKGTCAPPSPPTAPRRRRGDTPVPPCRSPWQRDPLPFVTAASNGGAVRSAPQ